MSSSSDGTDSYGENDLHEVGRSWGCMEQTLKQIISGASGGMSLAIDTPVCVQFAWTCKSSHYGYPRSIHANRFAS